MSTHTQIPWQHKAITPKGTQAIFSEGKRIATCYASYDCGQNKKSCAANAAFIIRAVNCHEELVAALKDVLTEMEVFDPRGNGRFMENARTALAKAEGRA